MSPTKEMSYDEFSAHCLEKMNLLDTKKPICRCKKIKANVKSQPPMTASELIMVSGTLTSCLLTAIIVPCILGQKWPYDDDMDDNKQTTAEATTEK